MLIAIVLAVYALAVLTDLIPSFQQTAKKEGVVSCILLSVSFIVLLLYSFGIILPGPSDAIKSFIGIFVKF